VYTSTVHHGAAGADAVATSVFAVAAVVCLLVAALTTRAYRQRSGS
jgi:hypothetical protein